MNSKNSKKPMDKKSMTIMWVIIAAIMVFAAASDGEALIPALGTMILVTVIILVSGAANRKNAGKTASKGAVSAAKPGERPTPRVFQHPDDPEVEEAVRCQHATGKEKYIQQLDSYLKAGLIDKAEYKLMKERYQKLEIPEDYH